MPANTELWKAHDIAQKLQDQIEVLPRVERAFVHVDHESTHIPVSPFLNMGCATKRFCDRNIERINERVYTRFTSHLLGIQLGSRYQRYPHHRLTARNASDICTTSSIILLRRPQSLTFDESSGICHYAWLNLNLHRCRLLDSRTSLRNSLSWEWSSRSSCHQFSRASTKIFRD